MLCAILYHLYNFKKVKNTYGGVLLLACNLTKSNTPPWTFSAFLNCTNGTKSRKALHTFSISFHLYQIAQRITYLVWSLWTCSYNGAFLLFIDRQITRQLKHVFGKGAGLEIYLEEGEGHTLGRKTRGESWHVLRRKTK